MKALLSLLLVLTFCACLVGRAAARAVTIYSVTDLGDFPGGQDYSQANGINPSGRAVGFSQNASRNRAFLSTVTANGIATLTDLGELPRLSSTGANSINSLGQIVGASGDGDKSRSFLWQPSAPNSSSGTMLEITGLPGERNNSAARSINDAGQVVGYSMGLAYLWTPSVPNGSIGAAVDLGGLPGGLDTSLAFGINASGQVVGSSSAEAGEHAFLWTPTTANGNSGAMIDLGNLPGGVGLSRAVAINASGSAIGDSVTATAQHGFVWRPTTPNGSTGSMIDLGDLEGGNDLSFAFGINAANEVVGHSNSADSDHAFIWTAANGMLDLNSLLDATGAAWTLTHAQGINDAGQIVGWGTFDPDGPGEIPPGTHAFRLEPVATVSTGQLYLAQESAGENTLRFLSTAGVTYQLQGTPDLRLGWQPAGETITGTGGLVRLIASQTGERFFWRVVQLP